MKKKSKFARMHKEARLAKNMGLDKSRRKLLVLGKELDKYCDKNNITGALRKKIVGVVALETADHSNFATALNNLAKTKDKRAFEPLTFLAKKCPPNRRGLVLIALGGLGDRRAYEVLVEVARDRNNGPSTRESAIEGLGRLGDARALPFLKEAIRDATLAPTSGYISAVEAIYSIKFLGKNRMDEVKKFLMVGGLEDYQAEALIVGHALDPKWTSQMPTAINDKTQRHKIAYLKNLIQDVKDKRVIEILETFNLLKPKKEGKR